MLEDVRRRLRIVCEERDGLKEQNTVMRREIKQHFAIKTSAIEKMEKLKSHIGLTSSESKSLCQVILRGILFQRSIALAVQEMDAIKAQHSEMVLANEHLASENALLRSQCEEHTKHCLLLIQENKRLMETSGPICSGENGAVEEHRKEH